MSGHSKWHDIPDVRRRDDAELIRVPKNSFSAHNHTRCTEQSGGRTMHIEQVDPRDIGWELDEPAYRAYFWSDGGSRSDEFELQDARDVFEVIDWANGPDGRGRDFTLYAVVDHGNERGLVHLAGVDPTRPA